MSIEAPALFTHDLNQLIVVVTRRFNGESFTVDGIEGDGIQINRMENKYTDLEISKDSRIAVRSANNNRAAKILITATQYSPVHQQMATLDISVPAEDIIDVIISDLSNQLLYAALGSYLSKFADAAYADAKGNRTHEVTAPFVEMDKTLVA